MNKQKFFNFNFLKNNKYSDFYINSTNENAYSGVLNGKSTNCLLIGPKKSGKSSLGIKWLNKNKALQYSDNFDLIIKNKKNVLIDEIKDYLDEEKLFHVINHCQFSNLKILITSEFDINEIKFSLNDLISRLKTFSIYKIYQPDDDMLLNILTKLFLEKQFVINSFEIFQYILKHADRSYEEIINIVEKLDSLSLEKKRQLTIPLIKEIL